jgi:hypothetical protein
VGNDGILAVPIYEYLCNQGHVSEHWSQLSERHQDQACTRCGLVAKYKISAPRVFGDYEGYVSPASGKWIEGRKARLEDMRATGCRPYELGEKEDVIRRAKDAEQEIDRAVDTAVDQTVAQINL